MGLKFHFLALDSGITKLILVLLLVAFIAVALVIGYYVTTDQSTPTPSSNPTFSPEPSTLPTSSVSPTTAASPTPSASPKPHATITLKITDTETKKFADNVTVFIDGKDVGATMQNGELAIENVEYGEHKISIVPYLEQYIVEQHVNISGDIILPISINIPNPVFQASAEVRADYITFRELGRISITLTNTGQIVSQNTIALAFVYVEPNLEDPVTNRTVNFGNITADAQPITKEIVGIDSFVWPNVEHVAVAIVDQWKYTPENNQIISQETVPPWFTDEILNHIHNYLKEHPEITGSITKIIFTR